jgi:hypothetical protein
MSQKKIIILIIILIIGTTGFFYLAISNQEAPKSLQGDSKGYEETSAQNQPFRDDREVLGWQIYQNKELGFSFKHPNNLTPETGIYTINVRVHRGGS